LRLVGAVLVLVSLVLIAAPAQAYAYWSSVQVDGSGAPPTLALGSAVTVTYSVSSSQYGCPTGDPVRLQFDSTVFSDGTPLAGTSCSATVRYVIPGSVECGQHTFEAWFHVPGYPYPSTDTSVVALLVHVACPATPGGILWGRTSGAAIVHQTVVMGAPRVPSGAIVRYYWKVGGSYTTDHTRGFVFPWSTLGKYVYGVVKVDEGGALFWHTYRFGPVRA
jgi:hypothetical protein